MGYEALEARAVSKIIKNMGREVQITEAGSAHVSSKTLTLFAIFDTQYVEINGMEVYRAMIFVETEVATGIAHDARVTVSGTEYDIKETHSDKHGMTAFILEEV